MTYEELQQENELLRFRVEELLQSSRLCPFPELRGAKFRILNLLAKRSPETVRYEALYHAMNDNPEYLAAPHKALKVHVCQARQVIEAEAIKIETLWGVGYRMPRESASKWQALVEAANPQEAAA